MDPCFDVEETGAVWGEGFGDLWEGVLGIVWVEEVGPRADGIFLFAWDTVEIAKFWGPAMALGCGFVDEGAHLCGSGGEASEFVALLESVFGEFFLGDIGDHHEEAGGFSIGGVDASDFPIDELGALGGLEIADCPSLEVVRGACGEGFWGKGEDLLGEFCGGWAVEELAEVASFEVVWRGAEDIGAGVIGSEDEQVGIDEHDADRGVLEADAGLFGAEAAPFGGPVGVGEVGEGDGEEGGQAGFIAEDFSVDAGESADARVVEPCAEGEGWGGLEGGGEERADPEACFGCDEGFPRSSEDVLLIQPYEAQEGGVGESAGASGVADPDGCGQVFEGIEVWGAHGQEGGEDTGSDHRCCSSGGRKGRKRFLSMAFM